MKKLKRYQYERYAILCQLAYPDADAQYQKILDPFHERHLVDKYGRMSVRILWVENKKEVIIVFRGSLGFKVSLFIGGLQDYLRSRCIQVQKHLMTRYLLESYS